MKIKKIKTLKINSYDFKVVWNKNISGAGFHYGDREIEIGSKNNTDQILFMLICHELMEICAVEMSVRFNRPDVGDDYIFMYDHRQHETMVNMFAGLISQFIR